MFLQTSLPVVDTVYAPVFGPMLRPLPTTSPSDLYMDSSLQSNVEFAADFHVKQEGADLTEAKPTWICTLKCSGCSAGSGLLNSTSNCFSLCRQADRR